MILPDVNVLINAFRRDASHHLVCRSWLDSAVLGDSRFAISPLALAAVVRVTTGPRFYEPPSTLSDAIGFCDDLLSLPNCAIVEAGPCHWAIFSRLCTATNTRGPKVADAWYAALAIEHGCEWITLDHDFARFSGLKWSLPAAPK